MFVERYLWILRQDLCSGSFSENEAMLSEYWGLLMTFQPLFGAIWQGMEVANGFGFDTWEALVQGASRQIQQAGRLFNAETGIFDFPLRTMVHFESLAATNGGQYKEGE